MEQLLCKEEMIKFPLGLVLRFCLDVPILVALSTGCL